MINKKLYGMVIVIVLILMLFVMPASADLQTEQPLSEFRGAPLPDSVIISEVGLNSKNPAVAYNSQRDQYLVVWYNDRPGNDDIQGQRLDKNGKLLGPKFFISAGDGQDRRYPDVTYNSTNDQYLVVWQVQGGGFGINAKRVSGLGVVDDLTDIVVRSTAYNLYTPGPPAVAYAKTSNQYLVVWSETWHPMPLQKDILGQMINVDGSLSGSRITISNDTGNGDYRVAPDIAYNRHDKRFLVVWEQRYSNYSVWGISGQQLRDTGDLYESNFIIHYETMDGLNPKAAPSPTSAGDIRYLVTFKGFYPATISHIRYDVVKNDGSVENKGYVTSSEKNEINPAVAANESNNEYLVTWTQPHQVGNATWDSIFGQNISSDGTKITQKKYIWGIKSMTSAVAAGKNGQYLVVYDDYWVADNSYISGTMWVPFKIFLPMIIR